MTPAQLSSENGARARRSLPGLPHGTVCFISGAKRFSVGTDSLQRYSTSRKTYRSRVLTAMPDAFRFMNSWYLWATRWE